MVVRVAQIAVDCCFYTTFRDLEVVLSCQLAGMVWIWQGCFRCQVCGVKTLVLPPMRGGSKVLVCKAEPGPNQSICPKGIELQRPSHCILRAGIPKLQFLHVFAIWIHLAYQGAILVAWTKFVYPKDRKAEFVLLQVRGGLNLGTLHPHALVRWQRPTWPSKQPWK